MDRPAEGYEHGAAPRGVHPATGYSMAAKKGRVAKAAAVTGAAKAVAMTAEKKVVKPMAKVVGLDKGKKPAPKKAAKKK